jgi:hypothetical protein
MGHSDKRRVLAWLKDLREKEYITWIYSTDFTEKSKPAIYYLSLNGIRFLKTRQRNDRGTISPYYPDAELRKRYKEHLRSRAFIDRSILVAECCLTLRRLNSIRIDANGNQTTKVVELSVAAIAWRPTTSYCGYTEADYLDPNRNYHFLAEHEQLRPNLCMVRQAYRPGEEKEIVITHYLLEIFDATFPRYHLRNRLKAYFSYLNDDEWEGQDPQPIVLLVCPNLADLMYAKRRTKKLFTDEYYDEIPEHMHIRFTTTEQLQKQGIAAVIWEEGRMRAGL